MTSRRWLELRLQNSKLQTKYQSNASVIYGFMEDSMYLVFVYVHINVLASNTKYVEKLPYFYIFLP